MSVIESSRSAGISVRSVSAQTGLSAHVLRNWERRYGVVRPGRDKSGRRVYTAEQVERLKALADASRQGHRISDLAPLRTDEIRKLVSSAPTVWQLQAKSIVDRLLDAIRRLSPQECHQALELADAVLIPEELVEHVLCPVLRQIGDCWQRDDVSIVQEHMFSELARQSLLARIHRFNDLSQGRVVVFATLAGEAERADEDVDQHQGHPKGRRDEQSSGAGDDCPLAERQRASDDLAPSAHGVRSETVDPFHG